MKLLIVTMSVILHPKTNKEYKPFVDENVHGMIGNDNNQILLVSTS